LKRWQRVTAGAGWGCSCPSWLEQVINELGEEDNHQEQQFHPDHRLDKRTGSNRVGWFVCPESG